jgi:RNA-directed DNA polymerase
MKVILILTFGLPRCFPWLLAMAMPSACLSLIISLSQIRKAILSKICTCDGKLPQGGVTSPALSNIVCIRLDERLSRLSGMNNITYTRYADDMTFSSKFPGHLEKYRVLIKEIIEDEGFALNEKKTTILGPRRQRKITGLIVSNNEVHIGKEQKRKIRAAIHKLLFGVLEEDERNSLNNWVVGWLNYLKSVDISAYKQLITFEEKKKLHRITFMLDAAANVINVFHGSQ